MAKNKSRNWDVGKSKVVARDLATSFTGPKTSALTLPADGLRCVRVGFNTGMFNQKTTFQLVERDRDLFKVMKKNAKRAGLKAEFYNGTLSTFVPKEPLDWVFADYNGLLNTAYALWFLNVLRPNLANDADVAVTLLYARRNSRFAKALAREFFERPGPKKFRWDLGAQLLLSDDVVLDYVALFSLLFYDREFTIHTVAKYRDTQSMLLLRFSGIERSKVCDRRRRELAGDLINFIESLETGPFVKKDRVSRARLAAMKAWQTRRKSASA